MLYNSVWVITMQAMFENVAVLLIFAFIGWFLGKRHILSCQNLKLLSVLEVWVFLPCNALRSFSSNFTVAYFREKYPLLVLSVVILTFFSTATSIIIPKLVKDPYRQNIFRYSLITPNYGYVGYALVQGVYGELMLLNAQLFALPLSVFTNSAGYRMLTNSGKVSWKKMISPSIVAILIGCVLGLTGWGLPSVLANVVGKGAACMGPISMLLAGITISEFPLSQLLKDKSAYLISAFRLVIIPVTLALVLSRFMSRDAVLVAVLIYACPCGLNTIVYPKLVGQDCRPGASMAMISTLSALLTLPLCVQLLDWLTL